MNIQSAAFVKSSEKIEQLPKPTLPEYAFIGRSNVGKSSLINMLTGRKKLAKTSGTPGKTKLINHFIINDEWYLIDLPGYGFAKVSKKEREKWDKLIKTYLQTRVTLQCVFVLIDSRIPPQQKDIDFVNWLGANAIPFVIALTKTDKQSPNQINQNFSQLKKALLKTWETLPQHFNTSAVSKEGREEILHFIETVNADFEKP